MIITEPPCETVKVRVRLVSGGLPLSVQIPTPFVFGVVLPTHVHCEWKNFALSTIIFHWSQCLTPPVNEREAVYNPLPVHGRGTQTQTGQTTMHSLTHMPNENLQRYIWSELNVSYKYRHEVMCTSAYVWVCKWENRWDFDKGRCGRTFRFGSVKRL